jgi:hypothetical protein
VLTDLDRTGSGCDVPGEAAGRGFTWDEQDRSDPRWYPQGVASLRSGPLLLVSWYAVRRLGWTRGSRLTVVDRSDPERPRYRHVLLVEPRRLRTFGRVPVHAGGIAVLGDLLYVADTRAGVRVFRLQDVLHLPPRPLDALLPWAGAGTRTLGRRLTGGHTAYGFPYVLPQLLRLRLSPEPGGRPLRYSFVFVGPVDGPALPGGRRVRPQGQQPAVGAVRRRRRDRPAGPQPVRALRAAGGPPAGAAADAGRGRARRDLVRQRELRSGQPR